MAAQSINCDACSENHAADVQTTEYNGQLRFFINCPSSGRVEIQAERLRRWRLSLLGLARVIASKLETKGQVKELVSQRQWDIGRAEIGDGIHEFMILRGLNWTDTSDVLKFDCNNKIAPVFFSLSSMSNISLNSAYIYLGAVLSVNSKGLTIDLPYLKTIMLSHKEDNQADYMFKREGDSWSVCFEGNHINVNNSLGMTYIAYLLSKPDEDVGIFELVALKHDKSVMEADPAYQGMSREQLQDEEGLSVSGFSDLGAILDDKAKKQYRDRLSDIEDELAEADDNEDVMRSERLEKEKDALMKQLTSAVGLGGRDRKAGSVVEKARVAVSKNILRAINNIREYDPELARFLDNSIKTGTSCKYSPDKNISWIFS